MILAVHFISLNCNIHGDHVCLMSATNAVANELCYLTHFVNQQYLCETTVIWGHKSYKPLQKPKDLHRATFEILPKALNLLKVPREEATGDSRLVSTGICDSSSLSESEMNFDKYTRKNGTVSRATYLPLLFSTVKRDEWSKQRIFTAWTAAWAASISDRCVPEEPI